MSDRPSAPPVRRSAARRRPLALAALLAAAPLPWAAGPAQAQQPPPDAAAAARLGEPRAYDLPSQALDATLTQIATQAGLRVSFDAGLLRGLVAPALRGQYAPEAALHEALAGSGLELVRTAGGVLSVRRATAQAAPGAAAGSREAVLPAVRVSAGAPDDGRGPVNRFVALEAGTATKGSASRLETPFSVAVVTREMLTTQNAQTSNEALRYLPGMLITASDSDRRTELRAGTIRGFAGTALIDGMRPGDGGWTASPIVDPYLLERVELLSGPASVLYGQGSPGGVVNFQTKRPTAQRLREVVLQTGSHDRKQGAFDIGGPLDREGRFLYRITGMALDTGTQVRYSKDERQALAAAFTWRPSDATRVTLLANYHHDPAKPAQRSLPWYGSYFDTPHGKAPTGLFIGEPGFNRFERRQRIVGYEVEHAFNGTWTVRQTLRYRDMDGSYRDVYGGLREDGLIGRTAWGTDDRATSLTADTQAEAKFALGASRHTVLLGLDYQRNKARTPRTIWQGIEPLDMHDPVYGRPLPDPLGGWTSDSESGYDRVGLYAQDVVEAGPWRLLGGLRRDTQADTWSRNLVTGERSRTPDSATTGRFGGGYLFANGVMPYASYAKSFEPNGGTFAPEARRRPLEPTTGRQFELGVKYQPNGSDSFSTLAVYDIKQQNVMTADPVYPNSSIQTGEVHSRGIEASVSLSAASGLDLMGSYRYGTIETTKSTDPAQIGKPPGWSPRHLASAWASYRFGAALPGLRAGGGVRYTGADHQDSNYTQRSERLPSFTLVDLGLNYDLGAAGRGLEGLELALNVTNLFDKVYLSHCNYYSCWWGDRRKVQLQARYRW